VGVLVYLVPLIVPLPVMFLGLFTSAIQALIFATLAAFYIGEGLHEFGNHAPTKNNKNNKSSLEKGVSIENVTRAFKLHRTIKDNRIDQNLSHLGQQLIHSLDGDLEKINQFLSGVKSKLTSGREPMSKEEALAISQQFSLSYMRAVQQAFSLSVDGF
jgi:hypothetical protein